jgi:uncharacterized membrane protein SirB2
MYTYRAPGNAYETGQNWAIGRRLEYNGRTNEGRSTILTYLMIKSLHMITAIATISGFVLRGYWMMTGSEYLTRKMVRIAPHVIDTMFLLSGIALVSILQLNAFSEPWLLAKFAGLIAYVVLGTIAIKRGPTLQIRVIAFVGALSLFAYIVGVAVTKSPVSWLRFLAG